MARLATPFRVAASAILIAVSAVNTPTRADQPATMFVIDGSGSMWAKFDPDKRAKIDIIRELLSAQLQSAPPTANVGLTSYGHRRRGDCGDAEVIAPLASDTNPSARDATLAAVAKLDPRGKGPLVFGLQQAVAAIGVTRPASIVVFADGPDNCQQDACAAATEIAKSAPGLAIHTIAIGVDPALHPRLACVPQATGGEFFDAADVEKLTTAIARTSEIAMLAPASGAPPPSIAPTAKSGVEATFALVENSAPLNLSAKWRILALAGGSVIASGDGARISHDLEAGDYVLDAAVQDVGIQMPFKVEAKQRTKLNLALNAARIVVAGQNAASASADATIVTLDTRDEPSADADRPPARAIALRPFSDRVVPPGNYRITISQGAVSRTDDITVAAGDEKKISADLSIGELRLSAAVRDDAALLTDIAFIVTADDPDSPNGRREIARSRAAEPRFAVPPGTYYVSARAGDAETRERIAVGAGETIAKKLLLPLVDVKISATVAGRALGEKDGVVYRLFELGNNTRELMRSLRPTLDIKLTPGRYRFAAHLDAFRIVSSRDITIEPTSEPGSKQDVVIAIDAADVQFKAAVVSAGDSYWEVRDATNRPIWHAVVPEPTALLPPGRYTATLETKAGRTAAAFEVKSGEKRTIEIGQK